MGKGRELCVCVYVCWGRRRSKLGRWKWEGGRGVRDMERGIEGREVGRNFRVIVERRGHVGRGCRAGRGGEATEVPWVGEGSGERMLRHPLFVKRRTCRVNRGWGVPTFHQTSS